MTTRILLLLILATIVWMVLRREVRKVLDRPDVRAARDFAQQVRQATDAAQRGPSERATGQPVKLEQCASCGTHVPQSSLQADSAGRLACEACRAGGS